jgi:hypothetical protein
MPGPEEKEISRRYGIAAVWAFGTAAVLLIVAWVLWVTNDDGASPGFS